MGKDLKGKEIGKGFTQRKDGIYQTRIFQKGYGKPLYLYDSNLKELKNRRKEYLLKQQCGININKHQLDFNTWFEIWMKTYVVGRLKSTTIRNYVHHYSRAKEYISNKKLCDITPVLIQNIVRQLKAENYAISSIKSTIGVLSMCFERAMQNRIVLFNPCKGVVFNEQSEGAICLLENINTLKRLSDNEIELFFKYSKNTRYNELFYILLHTGMRIGEACALQWTDINFKEKYIGISKTINRTEIYYDKKGNKLDKKKTIAQITPPKRSTSVRFIPINDNVIEAFRHWKEKQDQDKKKYGKKWGEKNFLLKDYPDPVFTTRNGNYYMPISVGNECRRITDIINKNEHMNNVNKIKIHPHKFRHTFITNCYESGMDPFVIMLISGHRNDKMSKHYTHPNIEFIKNEYFKYNRAA